MARIRWFLTLLLVIAALLASSSVVSYAQETPPWLQVWLLPNRLVEGPIVVEYRDSGGNTLASYILAVDNFMWARQGGGNLYAHSNDSIAMFSPREQTIMFYPAMGMQRSTDAEWYNLMQVVPTPEGSRYGYGVMMQHSDFEQPATNWIYLGNPGGEAQMLWVEDTESFMAIAPLGWSADEQTLLVHNMPQGIGGYILFWQNQNVRAIDLYTSTVTPLGDLDGYSADLRYTAVLERDEATWSPVALNVTETATGIVTRYPVPDVGEEITTGGGVFFSPDNARVAYQVARGIPEQEKYWTIVVDRATGASQIVFADEAVGYEVRYGNISGWLDANTLVLGSTWSDQSAIIDVTSGALVQEARGAFLGYAQGVADTTGFAPSGSTMHASCPGSPPSRLMTGIRGRITYTDGSMTNVRVWPGVSEDKVAEMPEGATFMVRSGPSCVDGYAWWELEFDTGVFGYVAEGSADGYFLEPWQ